MICAEEEKEYEKARRIKAGVLAFTAVVSVAVTSVPVYAVEDSP